jgi:hypothetical protein
MKKCSALQRELQPLLVAEYSADLDWNDYSPDLEYKPEMDIFPPGKMVNFRVASIAELVLVLYSYHLEYCAFGA